MQPFESRFARAWIIISEKEHIALQDLCSADDRLKKNKCYISGLNSDVTDENVKISKGKAPMAKRKKFSLQKKNPRVVDAEGEPELSCVKQEAEMEEDQGILVGDASRHLNIETPNNDGICKENRHNAAAKITQGDQEVLDQNAPSRKTKIITNGIVNDNVAEQENPVSNIANLTEGNKEAEDNGRPFDEQAEAILKSQPEWSNSCIKALRQPDFAMKDQDFEWNIIVSEDGMVKGPYQLYSLKCLQDIYSVSSFLKVFKTCESKESAILLGDALKLFSV